MKKSKKIGSVLLFILWGVLLILGVLIFRGARFTQRAFHIKFTELLYTLTSPLNGTGGDLLKLVPQYVGGPALLVLVVYVALVLLFGFVIPKRVRAKLHVQAFRLHFSFNPLKLIHFIAPLVAFAVLAVSILYADHILDIFDYFRTRSMTTTIYEDHFTDPKEVTITAPKDKKNLLLIYLESMEVTYASYEEGGYQQENLIPNMTKLAKENISFSNSDTLGGFRMTGPTTWTMAALYATSSGIPFSFPVEANNMYMYSTFSPNTTALGDILQQDGYTNEFLCGSEAAFGGRQNFYQTHGDYQIYDLFTARANGIIPEDYFVFWGYEDFRLYDIAKDELTRLSQQEEPFNLTMLTVDPHHNSGYVCEYCGTDYENPTANVIACADRQLSEFLQWCQEQPFYEDTVIVITGDHPRMDTQLVGHVEYTDRVMYNCFINAQSSVNGSLTNREFATMDMFPTILGALGYTIEGDRLALGTNLFSDRKTLTEELGYDYYNKELGKYSVFFAENFY